MLSDYSISAADLWIYLTLDTIALMCSSNVKDVSNIRPTCFYEIYWTGLLLKNIGGCTTFLILRVKRTSCACLDKSGLKVIFYWKAHPFILSKSSQNCLTVVPFGSFINVNKEVLSEKSFGFDWRFSVVYIDLKKLR